jgi:hypothetical protein
MNEIILNVWLFGRRGYMAASCPLEQPSAFHMAVTGHLGRVNPPPIENFVAKNLLRGRPGSKMVSFSCESCQDTIKKPKLDNVTISCLPC